MAGRLREASQVKVRGQSQVDLKKVLQQQLEQGLLCDVQLVVAGERVAAHRCVLAAMSPYFNSMFSGHFLETQQQQVDLTALLGCPDILHTTVNFMYGLAVEVTEEVVPQLLGAAAVFDLPELTLYCMRFLLDNLTVSNCLWTWSLASLHSLSELSNICKYVAICSFPHTLISVEETLKVPKEHMVQFMKDGLCSHCNLNEVESFISRYTEVISDKSIAEELKQIICDKFSSEAEMIKTDASATHSEKRNIEKNKEEGEEKRPQTRKQERDEKERNVHLSKGRSKTKLLAGSSHCGYKTKATLKKRERDNWEEPTSGESSDSRCDDTEEVLVWMLGPGQHLVYSPRGDQWYTYSPALSGHFYMSYGLEAFCVSGGEDMALFRSYHCTTAEGCLVSLTSDLQVSIPKVPLRFPGGKQGDVLTCKIKKRSIFCFNGDIFCMCLNMFVIGGPLGTVQCPLSIEKFTIKNPLSKGTWELETRYLCKDGVQAEMVYADNKECCIILFDGYSFQALRFTPQCKIVLMASFSIPSGIIGNRHGDMQIWKTCKEIYVKCDKLCVKYKVGTSTIEQSEPPERLILQGDCFGTAAVCQPVNSPFTNACYSLRKKLDRINFVYTWEKGGSLRGNIRSRPYFGECGLDMSTCTNVMLIRSRLLTLLRPESGQAFLEESLLSSLEKNQLMTEYRARVRPTALLCLDRPRVDYMVVSSNDESDDDTSGSSQAYGMSFLRDLV